MKLAPEQYGAGYSGVPNQEISEEASPPRTHFVLEPIPIHELMEQRGFGEQVYILICLPDDYTPLSKRDRLHQMAASYREAARKLRFFAQRLEETGEMDEAALRALNLHRRIEVSYLSSQAPSDNALVL